MKELIGTFNQEYALVGAFSVIVKSSKTFVQPSFKALQFSIQSYAFLASGAEAAESAECVARGRRSSAGVV